MRPFHCEHGVVVPLDRSDVDTDQIIPKQFLKRIERTGYGEFLFNDWRYDESGAERPDFVLNRPEYRSGTLLVAGRNFACGSSREHAVWALNDQGIRAVIAPSFADIFYENCFQNGVLPVVLPDEQVRRLSAEAKGGNHVFSVDLGAQTVIAPSGEIFHFDIDPGRKEKLLKGLDAVGETLQHHEHIGGFEDRRKLTHPWLEKRR